MKSDLAMYKSQLELMLLLLQSVVLVKMKLWTAFQFVHQVNNIIKHN